MLHVRVANPPPPHEAHRRLSRAHATTFILESRDGPDRLARYSFVGWDPAGTIRLGPEGLEVTGALPRPAEGEDPLAYLRRILAFYRSDDRTAPFAGGLVGSLGYDFVRTLEPTVERRQEHGGSGEAWPRVVLGLYLDGLVYDHRANTCSYVSRGPDRMADLAALRPGARPAAASGPAPKPFAVGPVEASTPRRAFVAQVEQAKALIAAGECFQVVLSRSYSAEYEGDLGACYDWLRDNARVPYLYYLRFGGSPELSLLGASPEMLVRVRDGLVETVPIAGTRPFTGTPEEDRRIAEELLADPKERAEHAMLVDLARNDLGRVCRPGTVAVRELMRVAPFGPLQHLVSLVEGRLEDGHDALHALCSVFPAGTVSGAPKLRAIEHIDAIEQAPRGPYAGAVLYASFNGDLDSAITIRSLSATGQGGKGTLVVQAGAGIVAGSRPEAEFEETRRKASSLLSALEWFGARIPKEAA